LHPTWLAIYAFLLLGVGLGGDRIHVCPSAFARSSGSTVESTLFSPRPLCLVPASPRPLARTMLK
jgi:hypothetical protein